MILEPSAVGQIGERIIMGVESSVDEQRTKHARAAGDAENADHKDVIQRLAGMALADEQINQQRDGHKRYGDRIAQRHEPPGQASDNR